MHLIPKVNRTRGGPRQKYIVNCPGGMFKGIVITSIVEPGGVTTRIYVGDMVDGHMSACNVPVGGVTARIFVGVRVII